MSTDRIYDISTDHLKCNFCVKYFKCSMHYANIQRYALKACPSCFNNFCYAVVHPQSYRIYKVLLIDMGIKIPLINNHPIMNNNNLKSMIYQERSHQSQKIWEQFIKIEEEIHNKITSHFYDEIKTILSQLQKTRSDFQKKCLQIKQKFEVNQHVLNDLSDLSHKIQTLKLFNFDGKTDNILQKTVSGVKDLNSSVTMKSTIRDSKYRKSSFEIHNKENIPFNNRKPNAGKSIKEKIVGCNNLMKQSSSKQSKGQLLKSRSTHSIYQSTNNLAQSLLRIPSQTNKQFQVKLKKHTSNQHEIQRNQINKLLGQKSQFVSYMPMEIHKDDSFTIKNQSYRNISESILQLREKTVKSGQLIEIIGQNMSKANFDCYLRSLGDISSVKVLRIIRCSLFDADMDHLLHFISKNPSIETLIITNNRLSQHSVEALLSFKQRHQQSKLSNIYMGNNHVNYFKVNQILKNNYIENLLIYI